MNVKPARFLYRLRFADRTRNVFARISIHRATTCNTDVTVKTARWNKASLEKSMTIRSKFGRESTKRRPKSSENRRKFALKRFWVLKAVSGTPRDALGTHPGRLRAAPGSILERPGRAKSNRDPDHHNIARTQYFSKNYIGEM